MTWIRDTEEEKERRSWGVIRVWVNKESGDELVILYNIGLADVTAIYYKFYGSGMYSEEDGIRTENVEELNNWIKEITKGQLELTAEDMEEIEGMIREEIESWEKEEE